MIKKEDSNSHKRPRAETEGRVMPRQTNKGVRKEGSPLTSLPTSPEKFIEV